MSQCLTKNCQIIRIVFAEFFLMQNNKENGFMFDILYISLVAVVAINLL